MKRLDIVVTCVDRKRGLAGPRIRDVAHADLDQQMRCWEDQLLDGPSSSRAVELYQGEAWQEATALQDDAQAAGFRHVVLWIVSAGYGLISGTDSVRAYAATFSAPSLDDVGRLPSGQRDVHRRRQWWKALSRSRALDTGRPRRLADLPLVTDGSPTVVVASAAYVSALGQDLMGLLAANPHACLVSAGRALDGTTALPAFDHRMQRLVGGSKISLNARTAGLLIEALANGIDRRDANADLRRRCARLAPLTTPRREAASNDAVLQFIRTERRRDPDVSRSRLLRRFRDAGHQCEQHRFAALFETVTASEQPMRRWLLWDREADGEPREDAIA